MNWLRLCAATLALSSLALASSPAAWEMTTFQDFVKGKFDGVSLGRDGRLSLAPRLDTLFTSEQPVIWSVAAAPDGSLYAGTGHRGRVFHIEPDGKATVVWTADHPEVFALAVDAKGVVFAASSPDGKIYRIENGRATEYFDPKAKYIWSLALAPDGTLYAGTGDDGRVFRITGAGKGEVWYATGQSNVTGLMLDQQGRLLAGTEPNGILYRITAKDKAFALYDSSLPELRAVAPNPDGSIYAVALGGALARKVKGIQTTPGATVDPSAPADISVTVTAAAGGDIKPVEPPKTPAAPTTTTTVSTADASTPANNVEKSAIYRINPDNTVDTLWSSKEENVYDILAGPDGQITFGTDVNGRVYELSRDRRLTLVAQTNEAEIVRLLRWKGSLLAATGNMGKIYMLGPSGAKGTYESPVFDAGSVAQWGRLRWQGEKSGSVVLRTRSGNSAHPDTTWSDWSEAVPAGARITSPNARFLQYEAELTGAGATIENISAAYLPQNNPPVVHSVTVMTTVTPASTATANAKSGSAASTATTPYTQTTSDSGDASASGATGTPTQTLSRAASQQLLIAWQADDPDGDKLVYQLDFRGEGEREWKTLKRDLHDTTYTIDGDALADGRYFFRVTASDRESNPGGSAREADLESSPILIDNTPPVVRVVSSTRTGTAADISIEATDSASVLKRAEWSLDAGSWTPMAPADGILDSETEQFSLHIANVPAGEHVVVIRVADSGNNTGLAKVVLR